MKSRTDQSNRKRTRHFLTDAAIYGMGGVLMQFVSVLLLPLYTRYLEPADYGVLEIIERVGHIINICLMTGGVRQACFAFYLQGDEQQRRSIAATISTFLLAIFAAASLVAVVSAPYLSPLLGVDDQTLFIFGTLVVLSQIFTIVPFSLMQARVESIAFITWQMAMLVARVTLAVFFLAVLGWGVWGVYWSLLIVFIGFGGGLMIRELRKGSLRIDWKQCREVTRFSLPFLPTGLIFIFFHNSDRFFLVGTAGTAALGIYALGYKLASAVGMVSSTPLFKVWSARMYATFEQPDAPAVAGRMLSRMLTAYAAVGLGLCLFHRELLAAMSSAAYGGAGAVIAPIVLANAFLFANNYFEGVYYVFRKTKYKPLTAFVGTVTILCLYATLIPRYSILGAAYGTLLGYMALAATTFVVAQRVFYVHYEIGHLSLLGAVSIGCYLPSIHLELGLLPFLARAALFLLWCVLVWGLGIVQQADKGRILSLLKRISVLKSVVSRYVMLSFCSAGIQFFRK